MLKTKQNKTKPEKPHFRRKMQIKPHAFPQLKTESPFAFGRFAVNYIFTPVVGVTDVFIMCVCPAGVPWGLPGDPSP